MIISWLIVAIVYWSNFRLRIESRKTSKRLKELEQAIEQGKQAKADGELKYAVTLSIGSLAPDFELPDLAGVRQRLSQWRGRGVLLIFFDPDCSFCVEMAPILGSQTASETNPGPMTLLISTGDIAKNRQFFGAHGIRSPVLVQKQMEVAIAYHATGTPTGYLIDERGLIASDLVVGAQALLALSETLNPSALTDEHLQITSHGEMEGGNDNGHQMQRDDSSLAKSRLARDGLAKGTPAPAFRLARLDNEELSLEQYRGQKILLVFSDPECGPCNLLCPRLERLARRTPDIQIIMVSRGDPEANRLKVEEYGLTFPVVLQKHWELSRLYAMFATPIAYLIDEEGVIAAEVATGPDAILTLLTTAAIMSLLDGQRVPAIDAESEQQDEQPLTATQ